MHKNIGGIVWTPALIKRVLPAFVLLLTLVVMLPVSVFAWMATNRSLDGDGMDMSMEYDDAVALFDVYKYNVKTSQGTTVENSVPLSLSNVDFNQYDMIFEVRNRYTPIFARMQIFKINKMPEAGTLTLTLTRDTSNGDATATSLNSYTSSIIRFTAKVDHTYDEQHDSDTPATFYNYVDNQLYEVTLGYAGNEAHDEGGSYTNASRCFTTFVTSGDTTTYTKAKTITLSMTYTAGDWDTNDDGYQVLNVYLYMTYDTGLIEKYIADNDMSTMSIGADIVDFTNDFVSVKISCTE